MNDPHSIQAWFGNTISGAAILATLAGWLPTVAAIVALIWYLIQIYESATVQRWLANRKHRRLAHLKARVIMLEAQGKPPLPSPFDSPKDGPETFR